MQDKISVYYSIKPTERVKAILKAVSKHITLQRKPLVPYLADDSVEVDSKVARILTSGFASMLGVHFTETCNFLCCEDNEYFTMVRKFDTYLCKPLPDNSTILKNSIAARYVVKYRKVANELGLNGVCPHVGNNYLQPPNKIQQ